MSLILSQPRYDQLNPVQNVYPYYVNAWTNERSSLTVEFTSALGGNYHDIIH